MTLCLSGTYTGQVDEIGARHGYGRLICDDGGNFEGYWDHGVLHGKGVYQWPNGNKHYGEWLYGERTGKGAYYWAAGDIYQGEFLRGNRHGKGTQWFFEGSKYSGEWCNDERHGRGILFVGPSQAIYSANWVMGRAHGYGIYRTQEGHVYEGNFLEGKRHGPGEIIWASGKHISAIWNNGVRDDSTVITLPNKEPWKPPQKFFNMRPVPPEVFFKRKDLSFLDRSIPETMEENSDIPINRSGNKYILSQKVTNGNPVGQRHRSSYATIVNRPTDISKLRRAATANTTTTNTNEITITIPELKEKIKNVSIKSTGDLDRQSIFEGVEIFSPFPSPTSSPETSSPTKTQIISENNTEKYEYSNNFDMYTIGKNKEKKEKITQREVALPYIAEDSETHLQSPSSFNNDNYVKKLRPQDVKYGLIRASKNFQIYIKGGTKEKLVECLTFEDVYYVQAFLITYRIFMTPEVLLEMLFEQYDIKEPSVDDPYYSSQLMVYNDKMSIAHKKIVNVVKIWLTSHFYDFDENLQLKLRRKVEKTFTANQQDRLVQRIIQTLEEQIEKEKNKTNTWDVLRQSLVFTVSPPVPVFPKSQKFEDFDPEEFARQICLYEQYLYQSIYARELISQLHDRSDSKAPHLMAMIRFSNNFIQWVVTQILLPKSEKGSAKVIEKFLLILIKCREYNNFSAVFEIYSAFQKDVIYRLKATWARVAKQQRNLWIKYEEISPLCSYENNFNNYRNILATAAQPCVPYIGRFVQDITHIEQNNPNYFDIENEPNIINFDKMRSLASIVQLFSVYQQTSYFFHKVEWIFNFLARGLTFCSNGECLEKSIAIEPKKDSNTLNPGRRTQF